jgi:hypothetical protein
MQSPGVFNKRKEVSGATFPTFPKRFQRPAPFKSSNVASPATSTPEPLADRAALLSEVLPAAERDGDVRKAAECLASRDSFVVRRAVICLELTLLLQDFTTEQQHYSNRFIAFKILHLQAPILEPKR